MSSPIGGNGGNGGGQPASRVGGGFMIVGLGASAGGIRALKEFFANAPERSGMAYVVILHLSPEHESQLAEVLQSSTRMPVMKVTEAVRVEPDHVYVIPPNKSLSMRDGALLLSDVTRIEERRAPVDIFFRTLADSHGARAACVVLSGTGANGSMGLKRVKEYGGLTTAQDPEEAEYAEMPRNSIATGLVDYVLPAAQIPGRLIAYRDALRLIEAGEADEEQPGARGLREQQALTAILTQLRMRTGHDFTNYKLPTLRRRIDRRIGVAQVAGMVEYAHFMREHPEEARALLKDLLISVTNFFRDRYAFYALEKEVIPKLFDDKGPAGYVRVWVAGCATGEEAYSIAMLLAEYAETLVAPPTIQVFASDIDEAAIQTARAGFYTLNDAADVSPERLRRFFTKVRDGYAVRRELREVVLFARHNLLKDPPFSHIDLVSCRNLLIYLNRAGQEKAMSIFHFAMNPGGYLFLGGSETASDYSDLFAGVDKESNIYQARSAGPRPVPHLAPSSAPAPRPAPSLLPAHVESRHELRAQERHSYLNLHRRLLELYAPPSVLLNAEYEIVHLSESAGRYLQMPGGVPSYNLLSVARPELRLELRSALFHASQHGTNVEVPNVQVHVDDRVETLRVTVRPVVRPDDTARGFFIVLFEPVAPPADVGPATEIIQPAEPAALQLEEELAHVKAQLRSTIEQYEVQHEELRASNEELQAMNEELRSTAEELETSKEELQSLNEELTTVNQELKHKIEEMGQLYNDLQNLIGSTEFATIFLDRSLRVKLFTPRARDIFNLIPTDVGRPISDITGQVAYSDLAADVERVYESLQPVEREIQTKDGRWHLQRVSPYRTDDDVINGVVLTFSDITERKRASEALSLSEERMHIMLDSAEDFAIFSMDAGGHIDSWFAGAERTFGFTAEEAVGRHADIIFTPEDRARGAAEAEMRVAREKGCASDERWHVRKDGSLFYASGVLRTLGDAPGAGYVKVARDLTEQQRAVEELRRTRDEMEQRVAERTEELRRTIEMMLAEVKERRAAEEQSRNLVGQLVSAQEDERRRISRDLHDQLGQQLTALRLKLAALREACGDNEELCAQVGAVQELAERVDSEVDFLAWELRPTALDDLGLTAALTNFVREWSKHYTIPAEIQIAGLDAGRLAPLTETCLYRITQEALNNISKYAQAALVSVVLERRDSEVVLVVEDDGVGFDPELKMPEGRGLGLVGMRERASLLGGSVEIESAPGRGTTIFARVPALLAEGGGDGR